MKQIIRIRIIKYERTEWFSVREMTAICYLCRSHWEAAIFAVCILDW